MDQYFRIHSEEEASTNPNSFVSVRLNRHRLWILFLWLSLATLFGAIGMHLLDGNRQGTDMLTCGTTNEEAIALGCVMEPMVYGWMPKPCYFEELSSQYSPFEDREWYTSKMYREEDRISAADLWAGKYAHIFAHQYHGDHCLFLWRKLHMAVSQGSKWLDHKTLDIQHTDHCVMELQDHGIEWKNSSSDVVLGFYRCLRL